MNILITPKSFHTYKEKIDPLLERAGYGILANDTGRTLTEDEIIELAKENVVGMIVGIDPLSERVLRSCRDLRAVSKYGVGLDNIDLKAAEKLNIKVVSALGSNHISVAELAIALMFEAARRVSVMIADVKNGGWSRVRGIELTGKTVGVIGGGMIGKEVAKRAKGLCMNVLLYDPYFNDFEFLEQHEITRCDSLPEILSVSDVVTLHLPLVPETRHLINSDTLQRMKPSAILINTSRGELVDEDSLYAALKDKRIAFAAQDVFSKEPPSPSEKLLTLDNFVLTPHAGAYTAEAVEKMAIRSVHNLMDLLKEMETRTRGGGEK
ncbi:phosphoglycerate dehydrogenase [Paenibacillus thermoaerophilus]|uniref:Phosphoglycerate dehydrogenase n=1 Tax=Paenibacillus thermoaerophilus TaxID=1215385 RepID=A0ABW2V3L1_9BACL|nr:phosphoglycerate dehydrogenase [Paenibacillus thermoaerophilus]TMV17188.1 phosphoglycerate dehydrogenase [Paenibacillus thermoaerophilus]